MDEHPHEHHRPAATPTPATDGPLVGHPLGNDPVSAGASQKMMIGDRVVFAISDGFLAMSEEMLGPPDHQTAAYEALAAEYGKPRLPLGCFFLPGEVNVLIDTGFGRDDYLQKGTMIGGNLLPQLARLGYGPEDIDVVALSHLHGDHAGGLAEIETGAPIFPNAKTYVGSGDWAHFIEGPAASAIPTHTRSGLDTLVEDGRLELIDGDTQIVPGLSRIDAPGHTPGHSIFLVHDLGERLLLLGDSMYCPQQLSNLDWSVTFDVDPVLARRTRRDALSRDLEIHGGAALGCHFPGLIAGRALRSEP